MARGFAEMKWRLEKAAGDAEQTQMNSDDEHLPASDKEIHLRRNAISFSRESSPPATSIFAVSRAPSIYLGDDSKHISIGYRTRVGGVEPDSVDPSLEHVSRPLKWKRCADISTDDVRAKKARTSGTSSDESIVDDSTSLGLGHILVHTSSEFYLII
ncbi:predicted protein [Postia placenta Mad-698-R]|nr:predicted protein [Postia placenta Mad-698-R]